MKKPIRMKAGASIGMTCAAGWDDKEVNAAFDKAEKELDVIAKAKNLKIDGLLWVYDLNKKKKPQ